ncbi:hypothetical protein GCK72_024518 [Caenorhabditis remanei]|uniref:Uncharacterized protein n=1 Tax=Caenorhabditis remanei TaxID=31234 RepID=E3LDQ3_CAERE|nr:hypothetical protein GCK72_024518 [Caenorhabditis remanei]EFO82339.1 hypothetical protein CRE_00666 [Caenorhabditis remanei]KAF1748051.1 hypothetical protein GCK72_024518 [Caenorhabditis remanei]
MTTDSASLKSSEGTCSSIGDEREKAKIVQKLVEIKDKLRALNEKREADVEKFLTVTKQAEISKGVGTDNPQRARIRNNFERQNRKHAQETETLQKKLTDYEERLKLVDIGEYEPSPSRSRVIPTGIRKAKGMTESMMNAQMELAQRVKSAFSADNVNSTHNGHGVGKTGQSTFFTARRSADAEDAEHAEKKKRDSVRGSSTLPPNLSFSDPLNAYKEDDISEPNSRPGSAADETNNMPYHTADNSLYFPPTNNVSHHHQSSRNEESFALINEHLNSILHHVMLIDRKYDRLEDDVKKEIKFYSEALEEERFKTTKLEELLNEAVELQQAEIASLKEQNLMATRVDFQHNDRFRTVEEKMESFENHMIRIENALMDVRQVKLTGNVWQRVALTAGNIVVELLKIALFVVASILDLVRPLTGSRNRSAVAFGLLFLAIFFGHHLQKVNYFFGNSADANKTGPK